MLVYLLQRVRDLNEYLSMLPFCLLLFQSLIFLYNFCISNSDKRIISDYHTSYNNKRFTYVDRGKFYQHFFPLFDCVEFDMWHEWKLRILGMKIGRHRNSDRRVTWQASKALGSQVHIKIKLLIRRRRVKRRERWVRENFNVISYILFFLRILRNDFRSFFFLLFYIQATKH